MSSPVSHTDEVKLVSHDGNQVLEIGKLRIRVQPTDNGVSFISSHPLKQVTGFDRPFGGFPKGFEGASLTLLEDSIQPDSIEQE